MISRQVVMLASCIGVIGANAFALSPIASAVAVSFSGVDASRVMNASAGYGLATAASALLLAPAIDRIGRRAGLSRAIAALTVALVICGLAPTLWVLSLGQMLAGLAAGCALPAVYALAADAAEKGRESETLGQVLTGWTASLVIGVSLSALVAEFLHWRLVFGGLAVVAGGLAAEVHRNRHFGEGVPAADPRSPLEVRHVPGLWTSLATVAFYMTAFYGLYAFLGTDLTGHLGLSTASAGLAPLAYGLGFGIAAPADRLLDRYGTIAVAPVAFLVLGMIYAAMAVVSDHSALLIALCLALGLANHVGLNLIVGQLTALDASRSGAIMGLYSTVTYLAVSVGTLLYRPLFIHFGLAGCALVSAACILPALLASLVRARQQVTRIPSARPGERQG